MSERLTLLMREFATALTWVGFGLALVFATRPVWDYLLFGSQLSIDEQLSVRCLGLSF